MGELVEVLANSVYKAGTHELEMQVSHIEGWGLWENKTTHYFKIKPDNSLQNHSTELT